MTSREACAAFPPLRADRRLQERASADGQAPRLAGATAAQPVLVEAAGHTCLAWWHAPRAGVSPSLPLAVVLASSWGEEDIAAYDGQRALAIALADAGLGTLRLEWPDTGDSSAPTGSTTIADALAAFDAAATRALALSGLERLAFIGLRLGAVLAAHAAAARLDVDALVALAPVAGGRAFVRDQTLIGAGLAAPLQGALLDPAQLPVSLGGFALPVRHLEALSALRWPTAATTSVLEALLVQPAQGGARTAADALARMGMRVCERLHPDPSAEPARADIVRWLCVRAADATVLRGVPAIEDFGVADPANAGSNAALAQAQLDAATGAVLALSKADATAWMRLREHGVALRERVVRIDDAGHSTLVGVLGEPDRADGDAWPRDAIVLLSSGRARRVGPHRLWVPWARHRTALGEVVLRLDVAGVGDSAPGLHDGPDDAPLAAEVSRAVAWLRREKGVRACTVVGIGAGATRAWRGALEGLAAERVIAVDPPTLGGPVPSPGAPRALRACARLLRPFEGESSIEPARAAARGVSLNLLLSQHGLGGAPAPRTLRRLRDGGVTVWHIASAHPGFASPGARARLYARLDALLSPARPGVGAPQVDEAVKVADTRASSAVEALRAIARSRGCAT